MIWKWSFQLRHVFAITSVVFANLKMDRRFGESNQKFGDDEFGILFSELLAKTIERLTVVECFRYNVEKDLIYVIAIFECFWRLTIFSLKNLSFVERRRSRCKVSLIKRTPNWRAMDSIALNCIAHQQWVNLNDSFPFPRLNLQTRMEFPFEFFWNCWYFFSFPTWKHSWNGNKSPKRMSTKKAINIAKASRSNICDLASVHMVIYRQIDNNPLSMWNGLYIRTTWIWLRMPKCVVVAAAVHCPKTLYQTQDTTCEVTLNESNYNCFATENVINYLLCVLG